MITINRTLPAFNDEDFFCVVNVGISIGTQGELVFPQTIDTMTYPKQIAR